MISAGELLRRTFGKTDGLDRLLDGEELDARITKALAEIARERTTDPDIFSWLDAMNSFQLKQLRADLIERLRERDEAAIARQEVDDQPAPGLLRVQPNVDLGFAFSPGGAIISRSERAVDDQREQQRAASLAAQRQAQLAQRTIEADELRANQAIRDAEAARIAPRGVPT